MLYFLIYSFMKYLKKFESLNEAKMFDDYKELIAHSKKYLGEIYIERPLEWKKKIKDIIEASGNTSFYNTSLELRNLSDEVRKDFTNLQNFYEDINAHIRELDEIYQKSEQLSPEDEKGYDELEKIESQTSNYIDFIEQYIEDLDKITESFINIDETVRHLLKLDFKSFY